MLGYESLWSWVGALRMVEGLRERGVPTEYLVILLILHHHSPDIDTSVNLWVIRKASSDHF